MPRKPPAWTTEGNDRWGETAGLRWRIIRHPALLCLNGYVELPAGHALWGVPMGDLALACHGGITWAGNYCPGDEHPTTEWWIGFDCSHYGDLVPGVERLAAIHGFTAIGARLGVKRTDVYRDMAYVTNELIGLCELIQITAMQTQSHDS